jgi:hypothetical protein
LRRILDAIEGLIERQAREDAVLTMHVEEIKKSIEELRGAIMVLETKGRTPTATPLPLGCGGCAMGSPARWLG